MLECEQIFIILFAKRKKPYNPFTRSEVPKAAAACCEEFGQVFYVFAMAANPMLAAPLVASYCIVSVVLGHIFLKERLGKIQYVSVFVLIAAVVMFGISESMAG